jgi:hypothetical protein
MALDHVHCSIGPTLTLLGLQAGAISFNAQMRQVAAGVPANCRDIIDELFWDS